MPRGKGIYDDEKTVDQKEPTDQGRDERDEGETPDVDERSEEPTA